MDSWGSPERSPGRGTPGRIPGGRLDHQDGGVSDVPSAGQRDSGGGRLWNRDRRLPEVKYSGIDTGGTYGPGVTRVSWVPEGS